MAFFVFFSLLVFGSFCVTLMPATRTITTALRTHFEPPVQLPAVVPVPSDEPQANPMAETLIGIEYSDALMIGLADELQEAA